MGHQKSTTQLTFICSESTIDTLEKANLCLGYICTFLLERDRGKAVHRFPFGQI